MKEINNQSATLFAIAQEAQSLEEFGLLLRDWIHHITRRDVSNRPALANALRKSPPSLAKKFEQGEVADAYLAAYAEWISDRAGIPRPSWVLQKHRILNQPWFSDNARAVLLVETPASFRQRGIFTIPENVVRLRRGRPRVSAEQKKAKARARDQRYREKIRQKLNKLKQLEEAGLA
jgi:hypothetical protein